MQNEIVTRDEWLVARRALLEQEKELTRRQDALALARQRLPWVRVQKPYRFETPSGAKTLAELFEGRSQLIVYHFMFAPGWEAGCTGCSFLADHLDGADQHLRQHDVTVTAVSRATLPEIEAYRARMGWRFAWASSHGSDFNRDFGVSFTEGSPGEYNFAPIATPPGELPGLSVFANDADGTVFHTYSAYGRGPEGLIGAYALLDFTPKGRNENGPHGNLMDWVKRHDEYADAPAAPACCAA